MKTLKNNNNFSNVVFAILTLILFFLKSSKVSGYLMIIWVFFLVYIILFSIQKKISEITFDDKEGIISFVFSSRFNTKRELFTYPISEVECIITKKAGANGKIMFFEIEVNSEAFFKLQIGSSGFNLEKLENLILHINKYKKENYEDKSQE